MEWMLKQDPVLLAFIFTTFAYLMTALGAAVVFCFRNVSQRWMNAMLGFAAGIMIAASFWSLLAPAIERAQGGKLPACLVVTLGFGAGALFLAGCDGAMAKVRALRSRPANRSERVRRTFLLVFAITLHNIPEGLAVGVAFGALAGAGAMDGQMLMGAMAVAMGIALQNLPEGAAVSTPLRREGMSRIKCFFIGQMSGLVEPIFGVLGAVLVIWAKPVLPYALSFAAGAMIYVVAEELLPEAQSRRSATGRLGSLGCVVGFALMMALDVGLG